MRFLSKRKLKYALAWLYPRYLSSALRVPVLCYHSVNSKLNDECDPIDPGLFEEHLRYIKENHTVISFRHFAEGLVYGTKVPKNAVVITFDDGYRDNYEVAYPLLKKYEAHATIFVVSGFVNKEVDLVGVPGWEAMSWDQLRELDKSAFVEIGAHTDTHPILSSLEPQNAEYEIGHSREELSKKLGRDVDLFAYPNGQGADISPSALKYIEDNSYLAACSTMWRTTHKKSQRYLINRVMVKGADDIGTLKLKLTGGYDYIYYLHKLKAFISLNIRGIGVWR